MLTPLYLQVTNPLRQDKSLHSFATSELVLSMLKEDKFACRREGLCADSFWLFEN
jgi:hypothetical protein